MDTFYWKAHDTYISDLTADNRNFGVLAVAVPPKNAKIILSSMGLESKTDDHVRYGKQSKNNRGLYRIGIGPEMMQHNVFDSGLNHQNLTTYLGLYRFGLLRDRKAHII